MSGIPAPSRCHRRRRYPNTGLNHEHISMQHNT
nr:MAG TPA: hypothetical protein [Bacteriophage sp.]